MSTLWCVTFVKRNFNLRWSPRNWMQSLPVLFPCCSEFIYRVVTVLYRCFWLLDNSLRFLPSGIQWDFLSLKGLETSTKLVLLPLRCYWEELSLHFHFFWKSASDPANSYTQMFWTVCNYSSNTINKHRKNISKHTISISPHNFYAKLATHLGGSKTKDLSPGWNWAFASRCQPIGATIVPPWQVNEMG